MATRSDRKPQGVPSKRRRAPKLGSRGRPDWLDLSDYLVHFAKGAHGYDTIMKILYTGLIRRGERPFGAAQNRKRIDRDAQRVVCFSETPLGFLQRIVERRGSSFGVGFSKRFVMERGGAPLWYVDQGSVQERALAALMSQAGADRDSPLWKLTPFVDVTRTGPRSYDFRWEREWRLADDLSFEPSDVAFAFMPEADHEAAWSFFENARNENTGPGYFCAYVDPMWPTDRVRKELALAAKRKEPPW